VHGEDAILLLRRPDEAGAPKRVHAPGPDILPSAGAGFVALRDIMTMPGSVEDARAEKIRVHPDGTIEGLF